MAQSIQRLPGVDPLLIKTFCPSLKVRLGRSSWIISTSFLFSSSLTLTLTASSKSTLLSMSEPVAEAMRLVPSDKNPGDTACAALPAMAAKVPSSAFLTLIFIFFTLTTTPVSMLAMTPIGIASCFCCCEQETAKQQARIGKILMMN